MAHAAARCLSWPLLAVAASTAIAAEMAVPGFTSAQAEEGARIYAVRCASCHGGSLSDGEFAPPLKGYDFLEKWRGRSVGDLSGFIEAQMPPGGAGTLNNGEVASLAAYILQANKAAAGPQPLPADPAMLAGVPLPDPIVATYGAVSGSAVVPPSPVKRRNPIDSYSSVTDVMLAKPADDDWLTWRRTPQADGYSPLRQVTRRNVASLGIAWAWSLPNGPNVGTPLVHDGVLFMPGSDSGDVLQAFDAATGELLWQHRHMLPAGTSPGFRKAIALYGDKVFISTSDLHVIALDAKSGRQAWDSIVTLPKGGVRRQLHGGPIVAGGMVIVGTGGDTPGGNLIVAFDATNGVEKWRFNTIAQPGEPGGESWNGLAASARTGGSVWNPGSYDPQSGLAYFGPAPTYDTGPLRVPSSDPALSRDALYTNHTLAFDPRTGELRWHFSHFPNDQWDLDWAFERQIVDIPFKGTTHRAVLTGNKGGVFDVLDAKSGAYLFSFDLGMQNLITSIDPKNGTKAFDPALWPGDGRTKFVCPYMQGGKNWFPDAVDPVNHLLFVPMAEACMEMAPVAPGEKGLLTGYNIKLRPRPGSDGRYGRIQAYDLARRKTAWVQRRRAPISTGVLATAGGVIFAGFVDRMLIAYDSATGEPVWHTRLNDVPDSNLISYAVNGIQYIAVVTSQGGSSPTIFSGLVPEIQNPKNRTSTLWVFRLAQSQVDATAIE